jgi:hypothetical protein
MAVNPSNPRQIVISSFTPDTTPLVTTGLYFHSSDGGTSWAQNSVIPGGTATFGTKDISVRFGSSGVLYAGVLRGDSNLRLNILRKANFTGPGQMTVLVDRTQIDQPWVEVVTQSGNDRVYVSSNDVSQRPISGGPTASVDFSLDAATAGPPAGFTTTVRLEARTSAALPGGSGRQDGPSVRTAIHPSGVLYGAFFGWRTFGSPNVSDIVVVRDDNWASGAAPFQALTDPGDLIAGRIVAANQQIASLGTNLGTQRIGSSLAIAVNPRNSQNVYVAWCDGLATSASPYRLRVRRSDDGGANWTGDLFVASDVTNPGLAVNERGKVALLYQQLVNVKGTNRWLTHLALSSNQFLTIDSDTILADVLDSGVGATITVIIGDYDNLIAVGSDFYGVFSAHNLPASANFPAGVTYLRNANFTTQQLLAVDNVTPVSASVDPFFFHYSDVGLPWLFALYADLLGRAPDPGGLAYWLGQLVAGQSPQSVAYGFVRSQEYCTSIITGLYEQLLDRQPDAAGLAFWVSTMEGGTSLQQIILSFCDSDEYRTNNPPPGQFVESLYQRLLNRASDPAGRQGWIDALAAGRSTADVINGFLASQEYCANRVTSLYQILLGRQPDAAGLAGWVASMTGGTPFQDIQQGFLTSTEYEERALTRFP